MTEDSPRRIDETVRLMFRAFEGPDAPRPRPAKSRRRRWRAVTVVVSIAIAGGTLLAVTFERAVEPRKAALSDTPSCGELTLAGRRYVARRVASGALAFGEALPTPAVVTCAEMRIRGARVVRLAGIDVALAVGRPEAHGLVYVAEGRCAKARRQEELIACLDASRTTS